MFKVFHSEMCANAAYKNTHRYGPVYTRIPHTGNVFLSLVFYIYFSFNCVSFLFCSEFLPFVLFYIFYIIVDVCVLLMLNKSFFSRLQYDGATKVGPANYDHPTIEFDFARTTFRRTRIYVADMNINAEI